MQVIAFEWKRGFSVRRCCHVVMSWLRTTSALEGTLRVQTHAVLLLSLTLTFDLSTQNHITSIGHPKVIPYNKSEHFGIFQDKQTNRQTDRLEQPTDADLQNRLQQHWHKTPQTRRWHIMLLSVCQTAVSVTNNISRTPQTKPDFEICSIKRSFILCIYYVYVCASVCELFVGRWKCKTWKCKKTVKPGFH